MDGPGSIPGSSEIFIFSTAFKPALRPTHESLDEVAIQTILCEATLKAVLTKQNIEIQY
jgi:hypothetical protein